MILVKVEKESGLKIEVLNARVHAHVNFAWLALDHF